MALLEKLYNYPAALDRILADGVDENGEISETALEALQQLELEREQKIEAIALKMKALLLEKEAYKAALENEKARLEKEIAACERDYEWLGRYLFNCLDGKGWKSEKAKVTFRPTTVAAVDDNKAFIAWAKEHDRADLLSERQTVTTTVSKTALKAALEAGDVLPGAKLQQNINASAK